ncbi:hypothetical protein FHS29_002999 [Saccharothrix tamanrassetensis]|uniref:Uncharacterized protein n=1 Tax=Saccharothrix tamanrassetensis TaxID=1051531 RepID=A0A841CHE6_9PSEU|nr:hypothetical protein [Saccharothrix tamanrassetensis]
MFTLRLADDSTIEVVVHPSEDLRWFSLTEYDGT